MTRRQIKELAARYAKFVEWSDEDKCFIGRCPELILGGVHGNDEAKVYAELCAAVGEMIEVIHAEGKAMPHPLGQKAFSGKFVLRVEPRDLSRMSEQVSEATQAEEGSFCTEVNPINRNHYQRGAPTFGLTLSNTQRTAAVHVRRLVRPRHFLISVFNENPMATSATNTGNTMTQTGCQGGSLTLGSDR